MLGLCYAQVVKLSDAVQPLPRQTTAFVHGVPHSFIKVGEEKAQPPPEGQRRFDNGAYFIGKVSPHAFSYSVCWSSQHLQDINHIHRAFHCAHLFLAPTFDSIHPDLIAVVAAIFLYLSLILLLLLSKFKADACCQIFLQGI